MEKGAKVREWQVFIGIIATQCLQKFLRFVFSLDNLQQKDKKIKG